MWRVVLKTFALVIFVLSAICSAQCVPGTLFPCLTLLTVALALWLGSEMRRK